MQSTSRALNWRFAPIKRFTDHAPDWDRLAARYRTAPFLSSDFIEPLLAEFGTGSEVLAIAESRGEVAGLAILGVANAGRRATFQPSQLPLGPVVLADSLRLEDALATLTRKLPVSTLVAGFTQIDSIVHPRPNDDSRQAVGDYIKTPWVDVEGRFVDYWDARGKNLRQNMRKQRRKLEEDNIVARLETIRDPAGVSDALADYGRLETAGWKAAGGTAVHPSNAQGRFYQEMLERFCARGRGCLYRYRFGEKVVAVDLCIENLDSMVILKTTYDESYKAVSPALLMRQDAFAQIWNEGRIRRIEFYGKTMEWHQRWTDKSRELYHLTCYRWGWVRSLNKLRRASDGTTEERAA